MHYLDSPKLLHRALERAEIESKSVKVLSSRGWRRKYLIESDDRKYVCYLGLRRSLTSRVVKASKLLSEHGVPSASIVYHNTQTTALYRPGAYVVILDYIPGDHANTNSHPDVLKSIAGAYSKVHRIRGEHPGPLGQPVRRSNGLLRFLQHPWNQCFKNIDSLALGFSSTSLASWLSDRSAVINSIDRYFLTHNDVDGNNIIVGEDNKIHLIDYDEMSYAIPALELSRCLLARYSNAQLDRQTVLIDSYEQDADAAAMELWRKHMVTWSVIAMMYRILPLTRRAARTPNPRTERFINFYWTWASRMIEAFPKGDGDWPLIASFCPSSDDD